MSRHIGKFFVVFCLLCLSSEMLLAQRSQLLNSKTGPTSSDTTEVYQSPSGIEGVPEDAVEFSSNDSLIIDLRDGKRVFLFGSSKVNHTSGKLSAGEININIDKSLMEASTLTPQDTLSQPVINVDDKEIRSRRVLFNYETEKGKFEAARVQVSEGNLIGSKVKNVSDSEVFIEDGVYSTCPPDYLYYYIKAKKMKVVDEDELFFSNARLYILDIPYPLVFPFGYVPTDIEKKRSGMLTPTYAYQGQQSRGIGLQNLGWFQYFNDYLTGEVNGDIYTSGSYYLNGIVQYRNQNSFSGSINIGYSNERGLEKTDPGYEEITQKSLSLRHRQTISPYASLSANVNLRTADYFTRNSYDVEDRAETSSRSSISYNYKQPENLYNFSASSRLVQNFFNNSTTLNGPRATFSLKTISPFQNEGSSQDQKWYNTISLTYNNQLETQFKYNPIDVDSAEVTFLEALTDPSLYREATGNDDYIRAGLKQTAGLRIGQLIPSQFLNISGSINYNEYLFPSTIRKSFNADSNRVEEEKVREFAAARDFNTSVSFSTTLYGTSFRKIGSLEGLRHTMRPSISFSYRPDFGDERWGVYKTVQADTNGNIEEYSIFEDEVFRGPSRGEQRSVSFSIRNVFEAKIVKRDSTGEVKENNLRIIDNLSLNTSYNFAADSLNLSDLSTNFSSNAIPGIRLNGRASFSFYQRDSLGRAINKFYIEDSKKIGQLESFSISASTSFRGGRSGVEAYTPVYRKRYDPFNQAIFRPIDPSYNYEPIPSFKTPWSVNLDFSYRWNYRFNAKPQKSAEINATNISFNLTPKWKFSTRLGYDFIGKDFTPSRFSLRRNLECWDLTFELSPFGEFQYYFFRLSVNSSQIQSLFQKLPILKNLERSSSPTGRGGGRRNTGRGGSIN
ncbi:MAG: LPS-assembly protein LptD [Balneolaceae bacterium]|nr:LPS-assembly protein LptD [Balneolaceae bacterium]